MATNCNSLSAMFQHKLTMAVQLMKNGTFIGKLKKYIILNTDNQIVSQKLLTRCQRNKHFP